LCGGIIFVSKSIGIDLGTTNSVIAVMEAGKPTVVTSRLRQLTSDLQQVAAGLSSAAFSGQGPQAAKQPGEQR